MPAPWAAFEPSQREALALLFLKLEQEGLPVTIMLWGAWLLPLGQLVRRSGFLPPLLGGWLMVNWLAYVAMGVAGVASAQGLYAVAPFVRPLLVGELAFTSWLLAFGARARVLRAASATA